MQSIRRLHWTLEFWDLVFPYTLIPDPYMYSLVPFQNWVGEYHMLGSLRAKVTFVKERHHHTREHIPLWQIIGFSTRHTPYYFWWWWPLLPPFHARRFLVKKHHLHNASPLKKCNGQLQLNKNCTKVLCCTLHSVQRHAGHKKCVGYPPQNSIKCYSFISNKNFSNNIF